MGHSEMTDGIHETSKPRQEPMGEKTTGAGTVRPQPLIQIPHTAHYQPQSAFDASGAIGKQFTSGGAIGGTAQKVGGPFSESGAVGKQFTTDGAVGGTVQNTLGQGESNSVTK